MINHKAELLAAVILEFGLKHIAYIGTDETFDATLKEMVGDHEMAGLPEDEKGRPIPASADAVYLDDWQGDLDTAIETAMGLVRPGAFLLGSEYLHSNLPVMKALERNFNLMRVQVGPAGSWCIQRPPQLEAVA